MKAGMHGSIYEDFFNYGHPVTDYFHHTTIADVDLKDCLLSRSELISILNEKISHAVQSRFYRSLAFLQMIEARESQPRRTCADRMDVIAHFGKRLLLKKRFQYEQARKLAIEHDSHYRRSQRFIQRYTIGKNTLLKQGTVYLAVLISVSASEERLRISG